MLGAGGLLLAGAASAQAAAPNVIVIYTDDHGTLDVNCYGAPDLCTPNMDALAASGVRFTQFYAAPVSSASRAGLMTGQFAARAGLTGNAGWTGFPPEKETVAQRMKANGYRTACIGKWHLGSRPEYAPNNRGFDYFWGFLGGCIDSYSHFYYWGGPNVHDLWRNGEEIVETDDPIAEIGMRCGFYNISNFNRAFRERIGSPPGDYRRKFGSTVISPDAKQVEEIGRKLDEMRCGQDSAGGGNPAAKVPAKG